MNYYKYDNKLVPIEIVGVDTNAPFDGCKMKLIVNSKYEIPDDINISNIVSLEEMYSKKTKEPLLIKVEEDEELINGQLVMFIDNNTKNSHIVIPGVGWNDDMTNYFNNIGIVIEHNSLHYKSYRILFNERKDWVILTSSLMKISNSIKPL